MVKGCSNGGKKKLKKKKKPEKERNDRNEEIKPKNFTISSRDLT